MTEHHPDRNTPQSLDFEAFLYATGQLHETEQRAFEQRLGCEPQTREALCRTMQGILNVAGPDAPAPTLSYREIVKRKLGLTSSPGLLRHAWRSMWGCYSYRGHPIFWVIVGALVTTFLLMGMDNNAENDDESDGDRIVTNEPTGIEGETQTVSIPEEQGGNSGSELNATETQRPTSDPDRRPRAEDTDSSPDSDRQPGPMSPAD